MFEGTYYDSFGRRYDLAPDGRFLMIKPPDAAEDGGSFADKIVVFRGTQAPRAHQPVAPKHRMLEPVCEWRGCLRSAARVAATLHQGSDVHYARWIRPGVAHCSCYISFRPSQPWSRGLR